MTEDINIRVINEAKGLQEKINKSSLSQEDKDVLSAKLVEALSKLNKGVNVSAKDLNIVSNNLRTIISELVKAAANAQKLSPAFEKAQKAIDQARTYREELLKESSSIKRTKLTPSGKLRTSAADQLVRESGIIGTRGSQIKTYATLTKFAQTDAGKNNPQIIALLEKINTIEQQFVQRLNDIQTNLIPTAERTIQGAQARQAESEIKNPSDSLAVQIQQFGNQLQDLIDNLKDANRELDVSSAATTDEGVDPSKDLESIKNFNQENNKTTSSIGRAFKQFSLYAVAFKSIKKAVSDAIITIKSLDASLTEQAMVIGKTREQTYALLSTYQDIASQTGATTREISSLVTEFVRQGKTTSESLTLTQAAMSAAKVASISAADSVNYLTTALNGFGLSASDAMSVSDKFAMVAASSATSYDELATALSKVASQANLAGMSIDYTTALLAKGLETTREAPETMGTALKTIIARMREISDYGETLSGDTDLNNVESQLAYVGIALRAANGELRSTEDVLDELGRKWDTLNSNQQAAVAKALAGTRQQSRLIAMMTDYERVVELQEVSERSSGATLSQMSTYLQGIDAALNRVSVAWESIVTSLTDSDVIINTINLVASFLDKLGEFLSTDFGVLALYTALAALGTKFVTQKLLQNKIAKENAAIEQQEYLTELKKSKATSDQLKAEKDQARITANNAVKAQEELIATKKTTLEQMKQNGASEVEIQAQEASIEVENKKLETLKAEAAEAEKEYQAEVATNNLLKDTLDLQSSSATLTNVLSTAWGGILSVLGAVAMVMRTIITLHKAESREIIKNWALKKKELITDKLSAGWKMAGSAAETPVTGWIIAAGILAALGIGLGIAALSGAFDNNASSAGGAADKINELSNSIYQLENKARSINTVVDSYDDLNQQIIKTKANQEEMNELLDQASDKLSDEEATAYNALATNTQKRNYLEAISAQASAQADKERREQLSYFNRLSSNERAKILASDATDSDILTAQSELYAINNNYLYDFIDRLDNAQEGVQELAQALLEELTPAEALAFANAPEQINSLIKTLNGLTTTADGSIVGVADILTSDDYDVIEKVHAYRQAIAALDTQMGEILTTVYSDVAAFAAFDEIVLQFIADNSVTTDGINTLGDALAKLGYNADESTLKLGQLFELIAEGSDIASAISEVFGELTDEQYNKVINAYSSALGTGILNMGQNITSLKNQIESFYEQASQWSTMSDTDKTAFLADNADLFKGAGGKQLLAAIESGDYNFIQQALGDNETLKTKVAQQIKDIDTELAIENAKLESERDEAYIKYLQQQKELLQDVDNLYAASLDTRLEQEQNYLKEYKSYLEDQRDALQESLEDRKEAYQDYFDAINQEAEDEDFEEQESTLIANIAKLATSTSADAINQAADLEQQLKDLEDERLQTLRERAQEQIIDNIEQTLDDINDKFDDLLNSQSALLAAMTGELDDPTEYLSRLISNKIDTEGLTELGLQDYIQTLRGTYGSVLGNDIFDNMTVEKQGNQLILNVAGTEIKLSDTDQQSVYAAIMAALRQVGYR